MGVIVELQSFGSSSVTVTKSHSARGKVNSIIFKAAFLLFLDRNILGAAEGANKFRVSFESGTFEVVTDNNSPPR